MADVVGEDDTISRKDFSISIKREFYMDLLTVLLVILVLSAIGVFPSWGYANHWGYAPVSGVGILFLIVLAIMLLGRGRNRI